MTEQSREPFVQKNYDPTTHEAKLAFRLTPPLIGNLLGLTRNGYLLLQIGFLAAFFLFLTRTFLSITSDIVSTAYLSVGFALIFVGNVLVSDYRGFFDGIAYAFMMMAMYFRKPYLIFAATFLASFTDERALIASPLIFLYLIVRENKVEDLDFKSLIRGNAASWAVVVSGVTYLICRFSLSKIFGLYTPTDGANLKLALVQINAWAFGVWTGLEGFWLLVIAAAVIFLITKRYWFLLVSFAFGFVVFVVAVCVADITRSMAYLFPLAIMSVVVIEKTNRRHARYLYFAAMLVSFFPTYVAGDKNTYMMAYPLLMQLYRILTGG